MEGEPSTGAREPIPLLTPVDGVPPVIVDPGELAAAAERLAAGTGPVAFDAERASGYRYSQRAYLVQIRRRGSGSLLLDPVALGGLEVVQTAVGDVEWVLHAANQDLPCLGELGLRPSRLFDTELAGRLLGYERVGLGMMVERVLGYGLEKGHSAADWSTRPLPEPWLRYAALDVELLVELRDALEAELIEQDKIEFARQEFAAIVAAPPREPRAEPWRRTSGIHRARTRRQLAAVRAMWSARDRLAQARDVAPGRVLPDSAIMDAVLHAPTDAAALIRLPVFSGPRIRRTANTWLDALRAAAALPDDELPAPAGPSGDGLPPPNRWAERDPVAAARLTRVRAGLSAVATARTMPVENLLEPALSRRLAWSPPSPLTEQGLRDALDAGGARAWQRDLTAPALLVALVDPPPDPAGERPARPVNRAPKRPGGARRSDAGQGRAGGAGSAGTDEAGGAGAAGGAHMGGADTGGAAVGGTGVGAAGERTRSRGGRGGRGGSRASRGAVGAGERGSAGPAASSSTGGPAGTEPASRDTGA
ncbi:Ribonuclease D [Frankia canadensis]|uniref:Ribonuclease D n=1 Tax=Frankia canadensis TaxID=1836972 RepID=A0A2I2KL10_9ACTN|nr:Ribonuclease D [Frankia canadensis]SOU53624.1 Ribonuclease D [Frankia canadensis]